MTKFMTDLHQHKEKGQALVTLLVFMTVALTITSAAIIMSVVNIQSTADTINGNDALRVAESGAEEAVLRIIRDTSYNGGTLTIAGGTATISVTGDTTKNIISEGVLGNYKRKISVTGSLSNNIFSVTSWNEIP